MKFWKHSLLAACSFLAIASMVTYSSCVNDSCKAIVCRNGGTCADEFCTCPSGYEGTQCEIKSMEKFVGFYDGITKVNQQTVIIDSANVDYVRGKLATVEAYIFSRPNDMITGEAGLTEVAVASTESKNVSFKWWMDINKDEFIEILIQEKVDTGTVVTNFQGKKRK